MNKIFYEIMHLLVVMIVLLGIFLIGKGITGMAIMLSPSISTMKYSSFSIFLGMLMLLTSLVLLRTVSLSKR